MVYYVGDILNEGSISVQNNPIKIKKVKTICVHSNEGSNIPHFHIEREKMHDCCIMLNDNRFFDHGDNDSILTVKECRLLEEWLSSPNRAKAGLTNWRVLADMWNNIPNARFKVDVSNKKDYSFIKPYK